MAFFGQTLHSAETSARINHHPVEGERAVETRVNALQCLPRRVCSREECVRSVCFEHTTKTRIRPLRPDKVAKQRATHIE